MSLPRKTEICHMEKTSKGPSPGGPNQKGRRGFSREKKKKVAATSPGGPNPTSVGKKGCTIQTLEGDEGGDQACQRHGMERGGGTQPMKIPQRGKESRTLNG